MVLITSSRALEFACTTKACAPPPVGSGGSNPGGSGGASSYGSKKLAKAGQSGHDIAWVKNNAAAGDLVLRGVVTTPGGREFALAWDEYDVGPWSAGVVIGQYSKLLDTYPDAPAVPLALGVEAAKQVFSNVYSNNPDHLQQLEKVHETSTGYVLNRPDTAQPLYMGYSNLINNTSLMQDPQMWGQGAHKLTSERKAEYVVTHEFGHVVHQHALSKMSPGQRATSMVNLDMQIEEFQRRGVTDVGKYALSLNRELFAEAFAVQTHGLSKADTSRLRDVTDPYLGGEAPRRVEWTA